MVLWVGAEGLTHLVRLGTAAVVVALPVRLNGPLRSKLQPDTVLAEDV